MGREKQFGLGNDIFVEKCSSGLKTMFESWEHILGRRKIVWVAKCSAGRQRGCWVDKMLFGSENVVLVGKNDVPVVYGSKMQFGSQNPVCPKKMPIGSKMWCLGRV